MTIRDEMIRNIEDYLVEYEGVTPLPERIRRAVREQVPAIRQVRPMRQPWILPRSLGTKTPSGLAVLAAALAVIGLIGWWIGAHTNVSSEPTSTPKPTAAALTPGTSVGTLQAGTYTVGRPMPVRFTLDLPYGWWLNVIEEGKFELRHVSAVSGARQQGGTPAVHDQGVVSVEVVTNVYRDPCHTAAGVVSPSPTRSVDDLTAALTHQRGIDAGPVEEVVIGGYRGKAFDLHAPLSTFEAHCDVNGHLSQWAHIGLDPVTGDVREIGAGAVMSGNTQDDAEPATQWITVLDVRGTVLLVDEMSWPQSPWTVVQLKGEMDAIVASLRFPPGN